MLNLSTYGLGLDVTFFELLKNRMGIIYEKKWNYWIIFGSSLPHHRCCAHSRDLWNISGANVTLWTGSLLLKKTTGLLQAHSIFFTVILHPCTVNMSSEPSFNASDAAKEWQRYQRSRRGFFLDLETLSNKYNCRFNVPKQSERKWKEFLSQGCTWMLKRPTAFMP